MKDLVYNNNNSNNNKNITNKKNKKRKQYNKINNISNNNNNKLQYPLEEHTLVALIISLGGGGGVTR